MGKNGSSANWLGFHYGLFSSLFIITKFNFITMNIYYNNSGFLIIEDLLNGHYESMSFLYYSKQEAKRIFKQKYSKYYHKNGHKIK